jgi:hypothetical protein
MNSPNRLKTGKNTIIGNAYHKSTAISTYDNIAKPTSKPYVND